MEMTEKDTKREAAEAMLVIGILGQPLTEVVLDKEVMSLGNGTWANTVDIPVASGLLADLHGRFNQTETGYSFEYLGNGTNTYYNTLRIGSKELDGRLKVDLEDGDLIQIHGDSGEVNEKELPVVIIYHRRHDKKIQWHTFDLTEKGVKYYISRNEELSQGKEEVSQDVAELPTHYATLEECEGSWYVADHNTKFGVSINHQKIGDRQLLKPLDVIQIGNTLFLYGQHTLYYNHKDASTNCLMINIEERSVWNLFKKHVLLEDINLNIRPEEMVLILGGSGAGKTTFINAVMGYEKAKGKIMEGDVDIYRNYNQMKYEIGFVPQQDLLRMEDTVYATLENAAELKMPKSTTLEDRKKRIEDVLVLFGLEREKDSLVSKLSGGQRKRLSISVEFIADPSLFFLDEPDSGLDGIMARSLMEDLRMVADQGKMVLVITHSPDRVADLFDKVIVLAKGNTDNIGHMAFFGTIAEAHAFFETDTMEGIVRRINREDEGGEGLADTFIEKYKQIEGTKS